MSVDNSSDMNLCFTFKASRGGANVAASKDSIFYSCPEKIQIPMITDAIISEAIVMLRANNAIENHHIIFPNIPTNEPYTMEIVVADEFGTDAAIWPLHFEGVVWYIDLATEVGPKYFTLSGISEVFADSIFSDVSSISTSHSVTKYINQDILYIQRNGKIYNVLGACIE
jgi:hypothetical protein